MLIIAGLDKFDLNDYFDNVGLWGYDKTHKVIKWLREILEEFTEA